MDINRNKNDVKSRSGDKISKLGVRFFMKEGEKISRLWVLKSRDFIFLRGWRGDVYVLVRARRNGEYLGKKKIEGFLLMVDCECWRM